MAKQQTTTIHLDIDTHSLTHAVERSVTESLTARFDELLAEAVKEKVHALVDQLTRREIEKAVKAAIDEGWAVTDNYGEPVGPKLSLKGRIAEILTKQTGDYNRRTTCVERIATEVIDGAFRAEFGKQIKAAQEQFKTQLDGVVAAKFTETIKAALGLR